MLDSSPNPADIQKDNCSSKTMVSDSDGDVVRSNGAVGGGPVGPEVGAGLVVTEPHNCMAFSKS